MYIGAHATHRLSCDEAAMRNMLTLRQRGGASRRLYNGTPPVIPRVMEHWKGWWDGDKKRRDCSKATSPVVSFLFFAAAYRVAVTV